jgi:hypothetical protein
MWILLQVDEECMLSVPRDVMSSHSYQDLRAIMWSSKCIELGIVKNGVYFMTEKLEALSTNHQETIHEYQWLLSELVKEVVGIACKILLSPLLWHSHNLSFAQQHIHPYWRILTTLSHTYCMITVTFLMCRLVGEGEFQIISECCY